MNIALIRRKFGVSMATYDDNARAQREIADKLYALVRRHYRSAPSKIFEIGCGTGLLTAKMPTDFPDAHYILNDLSERAESFVAALFDKGNYTFLPGDAQRLDFPSDVDLIVSSSVIQWFDSLPSFVRKVSGSLAAEGRVFLSSFGRDNLKEIREIAGGGLHYLSLDELRATFEERFEVLHLSEEEIPLVFASPLDVLAHLRNTGVNATARGTIGSRGELRAFREEYERRFSCTEGVRLTYNPVYLVLKHK